MAVVETAGKVAVGRIVDIGKPWNPLGTRAMVRVEVDGDIVTVLIDRRHLDYFKKKFALKSPVALGFYGGEWHLGSPPEAEPSKSELDLLHIEMEGSELMGLIGKPASGRIRDDHDAVLDDIEQHREYIQFVETDIKEHGSEILDRLGLAHLKADMSRATYNEPVKKKHRPHGKGDKLDVIIDQNKEILSNQKEILRLLRKYVYPAEVVVRTKSKFN